MSANVSRRMAMAGAAVAIMGLAVPGAYAKPAKYANPELLMTAAALEGMLGRPDVVILDVRPEAAYGEGHIPGAVHLGADDIIDPNSHVEGELLPPETLAAMLGERGIGAKTKIVLYDDQGGFPAARLFWMLEYFGHQHASILNGGITKWQQEGRQLSTSVPAVQPAIFALTLTERRLATADWILDRRDDPSVVVIDVRPEKMYRAGHIPWAHSIPWSENLAPDKTMKSADVLLKQFAARGVTQDKNVAVHCQQGKAAAHSYFTLRLLGYPRVRSYDRSWAEWGAAEDLPKATGQ
jgi:thiosulfate/3-mercaptopyruvate sulfurtransferase